MPTDGWRFSPVKRQDIELDKVGLSSILTGSAVTAMVHDVAQGIANSAESYIPAGSSYFTSPGDVRGHVTITYYTASGGRLIGTRAAALVTIAFIRGAAIETRYGPLRRAAAAQGVPVHHKRGR